jgi:hypothetical protein
MSERNIFIGDIQGCYDEFTQLLQKVDYNDAQDNLYLVGDVINRGPKSHLMLDYLLAHPAVKVVMGNHEYHFLDWLGDDNRDPNSSFSKLYQQLEPKLLDYLDMFSSWPFYYETDNWIMVHAGCWPERELKDTDPLLLCSMREIEIEGINQAWYDFYKGEKLVIFGHWARRGLIDREKVKGLDSGCVYGKELSAYILEGNQFISTPAKQMWYDPIKKCENW